ANHRRIEIIEAFTLNEVDNLRTHSTNSPALFENNCTIGFLNRLRNRFDVDRTNCTKIDNVDLDVFFRELISHLHRDENHLAMRDDRAVASFALQLGFSDWNRDITIRHFALGVVQHFSLEKYNRIVVANCGFEQSLCVCRGSRRDDLETWYV